MDAAKLHDAIAAACPIVGITIGREDDRSTWSITFAPEATDAQKQAAEALLLSYVEPPPVIIVTRYQLMQALVTLNKRAAWDTLMTTTKQANQDYWTGRTDFPSDSPKLGRLAAQAGLDPVALFATAAVI